jgi:hypothetical protein
MEASMRLTTIGVNFFQHDGFAVGTGWHEFDYSEADKKARASFREHVGRFAKIHPDDIGALAEFGLKLEGGRIVEASGAERRDAPETPAPSHAAAPTPKGGKPR